MQELYWKIFSQTGNVETYLLIKELETNRLDAETIGTKEKQDPSGEFIREL